MKLQNDGSTAGDVCFCELVGVEVSSRRDEFIKTDGGFQRVVEIGRYVDYEEITNAVETPHFR